MNFHKIIRSLTMGLFLTAALSVPAHLVYAEDESEASASVNYNTYVQGLFEVECKSNNDYIWDIRSCTVNDLAATELQLYHSLDVNQQKFYFENYAENCWRISDVRSGNALTVSSDAANVSFTSMQHPAADAQTFSLTENEDGSFYIQSADGNYLTMTGRRAYCGNRISLAPFNGQENQKWILHPAWISETDSADTDLVNPYGEDGPYKNLYLMLKFDTATEILDSTSLAAHTIENDFHEYILDPEYLNTFVANLAAKYDTGEVTRAFQTTAGQTIYFTKGTYGWKLDQSAMVSLLTENLTQDKTKVLKPIWKNSIVKVGNDNGINDIGDSYVEVDLGVQKVWLYKNGEMILESDCVTGTRGYTDTVQGVYAVFLKQSPATLTGPGYSSPVDFWMPFYNGYGLHNASWRGSFGGDIYTYNGSHGCVNLPNDSAKTIYDTVCVGYPVVVYSSLPEYANY